MDQKLLPKLIAEIKKFSNPERAKVSGWFFKTGKGDYGYGDKFIGLTVPLQRKIADKFVDISLKDLGKLLKSDIHEHRFIALEILVMKYEKGLENKKKIIDFYLKNTKHINNWDLVDTSAPYIMGNFLLNRPKNILYKLAQSKNIWERRIAIVSTLEFIRNNKFSDTIKISKILLKDSHDLIHKAVGWALREMGKKNEKMLVGFLNQYYKKMPRTALRYSIERLSEKQTKFYMKR